MALDFYSPAWVTTSMMTEALELDIELICEDSSTGHENKVARMALAVVARRPWSLLRTRMHGAGLRLPNPRGNDE